MNATFDQVTHLSNALNQAETVAKSHVEHVKKMEMAAHDAITVVSLFQCYISSVYNNSSQDDYRKLKRSTNTLLNVGNLADYWSNKSLYRKRWKHNVSLSRSLVS